MPLCVQDDNSEIRNAGRTTRRQTGLPLWSSRMPHRGEPREGAPPAQVQRAGTKDQGFQSETGRCLGRLLPQDR